MIMNCFQQVVIFTILLQVNIPTLIQTKFLRTNLRLPLIHSITIIFKEVPQRCNIFFCLIINFGVPTILPHNNQVPLLIVLYILFKIFFSVLKIIINFAHNQKVQLKPIYMKYEAPIKNRDLCRPSSCNVRHPRQFLQSLVFVKGSGSLPEIEQKRSQRSSWQHRAH